jgi:Uma2 family endonuclease
LRQVEGYWPSAPDLAVEVIRPSDTYTSVEEKVAEYLQAGAKAVWVVHPHQ